MDSDYVDVILEQWVRERPDLDATPIGIVGRISRAARYLERELEEVFARRGLSLWSFDMLATLRRHGPPFRLSATDLARATLVTSGTMTNRIDQLEKGGLVERLRDPSDRRGVLVALTPAGRAEIDAALGEHLANEARLIAPLEPREREALGALLRTLLRSLEARGDSAPVVP